MLEVIHGQIKSSTVGVHRHGGLVQHFDDPQLWQEVGYEVVGGKLELGANVKLRRRASSYPEYFPKLLKANDALVVKEFVSEFEQAGWVANEIRQNLQNDELEHDDILIVLPSAYTAKSASRKVIDALGAVGIQSHLAGATTSADELFLPKSVAIAQIYRAKGNEAPMVYVLNADECFGGYLRVPHRVPATCRSRAAWPDRRVICPGRNQSPLPHGRIPDESFPPPECQADRPSGRLASRPPLCVPIWSDQLASAVLPNRNALPKEFN